MAKSLFLLLISNIIGIAFGFNYLSATDTIQTKTPGFDATQMETIPEIVENVSVQPSIVEAAPAPVTAPAPAVAAAPVAPVQVYVPSYVNYNVTIVTDKLVIDGLSYSDIYRTGKFIYGHNTANLLGNLTSLRHGEIFTLTEGGVTRQYRVIDSNIYEKAANGYLNGSKAVTKQVEINANGYDISIMTCYGTPYGNGDASHRYVIFANAV